MPKLIVGLGNPGLEYELTRHNIAWLALDNLEYFESLNFKSKFKGIYAQKTIDGDAVYFLKPETYMNLSGESVGPLMKFFKVDVKDILIVQDEIDLPFGTIVFKDGGGLAGHNGLKSISSVLGTQDYKRLRLGIGRPVHGSVSSWVLAKFTNDDMISLEKYLKASADAIDTFIKDGFTKASRKFNKKSFI